MGEVICVYKVMPDSPESFESVKKALEELKPERIEEEPLAFGLVVLKFTIIIPDGSGELEELEEKLNRIPNVSSVENILTTRAL
jgi:translation elongation factor aEF-1 beta